MPSYELSWAQLSAMAFSVMAVAFSVLLMYMGNLPAQLRQTAPPQHDPAAPPQPAPVFSFPPDVRQRIQTFRETGNGLRNFRALAHTVMKLLAVKRSWAKTGQWLNKVYIKDLTEHLVRRDGRLRHTGVRHIGVRPPLARIVSPEPVTFARVSTWAPVGVRHN